MQPNLEVTDTDFQTIKFSNHQIHVAVAVFRLTLSSIVPGFGL
jgi:hypothetical protein